MSDKYSMQDVLTLMANLRHPQLGCNWDLKQSMRSLTSHTLEEVYEVIDAVEKDDDAQLADELGDLLFQIVFYAQIASEEKRFDFTDVCDAIVRKLLHRHPHIFPDATLESFGSSERAGISAEQVALNWEQIKNAERARKGGADREISLMDDVPASLPAMNRAAKLQKRAASVGFDWSSSGPVLEKLREELAELETEIAASARDNMLAELGDVMFTCVNLARHLAVDPDAALRASNAKFEARFRAVERIAAARGLVLAGMSNEEMNELWDEIKKDGSDNLAM